jgi:DNA polymerase-3 subunit delta
MTTADPAAPAPVNAVVGDEELLLERAVTGLVAAARSALSALAADGPAGAGPAGEVPGADDTADRLASSLAPGELAGLLSPSLFGGGRVAVIRSAQDAGIQIAEEITAYAAAPPADAVLILTFAGSAAAATRDRSAAGGAGTSRGRSATGKASRAGGPGRGGGAGGSAGAGGGGRGRGGGLLAALAAHGARIIEVPKITGPRERIDFVRDELRRAGRTAGPDGVRALLDAVGTDLRDLAAACSQLATDTSGVIDEAAVMRYYRGRAEASGFSVADRAVEGRIADALEQLRWALATGVAPVLITSALAQGLRALAKVGSAPPGLRGVALMRELEMPQWKIDRVRKQLHGWNGAGVARAVQAVAEADEEVKGAGTNAAYALERAVRKVVAARAAG